LQDRLKILTAHGPLDGLASKFSEQAQKATFRKPDFSGLGRRPLQPAPVAAYAMGKSEESFQGSRCCSFA